MTGGSPLTIHSKPTASEMASLIAQLDNSLKDYEKHKEERS